MAYKPIESYGVIGDLHTVALVGMGGSTGSIPHPTQPLCTLRVRRCRRLTQRSLPGSPLRLYLGRTCAD